MALATLQELAADQNDCMARLNAASKRLGLIPKPRPNTVARAVHITVIDPKTGRVVKP